MQLSSQLFTFRKKALPYLYFVDSLRNDAVQWANKKLQKGILSEESNINSPELKDAINLMSNPENHFLVTRKYGHKYFTLRRDTSLEYSLLVISPFKSFYHRKSLTDMEKDIITRLFPVGVNGFKKELSLRAIKLYMEFNRPLLEYLVEHAQFFLFADCLSGDFNRRCAAYLKYGFGIHKDRVFYTNKRHPEEYWLDLKEKSKFIIKEFEFEETAANWLGHYLDNYNDQWSGTENGKTLFGGYAHKFGKIRHVPGLDLIHIHKVSEQFKEKCRKYYERTGRKALVILMDDSI